MRPCRRCSPVPDLRFTPSRTMHLVELSQFMYQIDYRPEPKTEDGVTIWLKRLQ